MLTALTPAGVSGINAKQAPRLRGKRIPPPGPGNAAPRPIPIRPPTAAPPPARRATGNDAIPRPGRAARRRHAAGNSAARNSFPPAGHDLARPAGLRLRSRARPQPLRLVAAADSRDANAPFLYVERVFHRDAVAVPRVAAPGRTPPQTHRPAAAGRYVHRHSGYPLAGGGKGVPPGCLAAGLAGRVLPPLVPVVSAAAGRGLYAGGAAGLAVPAPAVVAAGSADAAAPVLQTGKALAPIRPQARCRSRP